MTENRTPARWNVRVYGVCVSNGRLLVNDELIKGYRVIKFAGGGLELGEGPIDGLIREWKEELNLDIEVLEHFYTTDFFQPSKFDDSQVISIYYLVSVPEPCELVNAEKDERTFWMPLEELKEDTFTLPIDRVVGNMVMKNWKVAG